MTDEKRTPNAPFRPVGTYRGQEPKATVEVEAAPAWAIKMQEGINANHRLVVEEIHGIRADVEALKEWRKTGKHTPVDVTGPQKTLSGEVRRVSENDLSQDAAIAKLLAQQTTTDAKVTALIDSQATQTAMQVDIKSAVTGFMKQHPELGVSLATLLGVLIALATQLLQAKVHP